MNDSMVRRLMELADDFAEETQDDGREYPLTGDENWSKAAFDKRATLESALRSTPWRAEAARWLRRKADQSTTEAGKTGWANPDYWRPQMLIRAAEELEAEQEAAPYGEDYPSDGLP
jgi:hypothetical protein